MKQFNYSEEKIIHKGRVYYLRCKFGRRGVVCTYTIRTHRNGKGINKAQVKGLVSDSEAELKLLHRLYKKMPFEYVVLTPLAPLPK